MKLPELKSRILTLVYFATGAACILADYIPFPVPSTVTKSLLMPLLALLLTVNLRVVESRSHFLILLALIFSWAGDLLLEFTGRGESFFMAGLAAFLAAQAMYLTVFATTPGTSRITGIRLILLLPVLLYGIALVLFMIDDLGNMKLPVMVYAVIILSMLGGAICRAGMVSRKSYLMVLAGAILFVISDSTLAISRFSIRFTLSGAVVMSTYITAQYLIITGYIQQFRVGMVQNSPESIRT